MALWIALREAPRWGWPRLGFLWNTGGTWQGGVSEAARTRRYALERLAELPARFPRFFAAADDLAALRGRLLEGSILEERSTNTRSSMEEAARIIRGLPALEQLILVSSANHGPRVMRDAARVLDDPAFGVPRRVRFSVERAPTCDRGWGLEQVTIIERDAGRRAAAGEPYAASAERKPDLHRPRSPSGRTDGSADHREGLS